MKPFQSHLNLNLKKFKNGALILASTRLPLQTWANAVVFNFLSQFLKWERLDFVSSRVLEVINCLMISKNLCKTKGLRFNMLWCLFPLDYWFLCNSVSILSFFSSSIFLCLPFFLFFSSLSLLPWHILNIYKNAENDVKLPGCATMTQMS